MKDYENWNKASSLDRIKMTKNWLDWPKKFHNDKPYFFVLDWNSWHRQTLTWHQQTLTLPKKYAGAVGFAPLQKNIMHGG